MNLNLAISEVCRVIDNVELATIQPRKNRRYDLIKTHCFRNNGTVGLAGSELQHYFGVMTSGFFRECLFRFAKGVQSGNNILHPQPGDQIQSLVI